MLCEIHRYLPIETRRLLISSYTRRAEPSRHHRVDLGKREPTIKTGCKRNRCHLLCSLRCQRQCGLDQHVIAVCRNAGWTIWPQATNKIEPAFQPLANVREFVQLYRGYGQLALVPEQMMMSKNKKIVVATKTAPRKTQKAYRAKGAAR